MTQILNEEETKALVDYRLERANATLKEARVLFDSECYIATANRLYYASFYAVQAALLSIHANSATHSGAKTLFNLHFVKTGLVEMRWGKWYTDICNMRETGDYDDFVTYQKQDVEPIIPEVEEFINLMRTQVISNVADQK